MEVLQAKVIDSTHLELFKPLSGKDGQTVVLFVATPEDPEDEHREWVSFSLRRLQSAYHESEPAYETKMIREKNPEYGL